MELSNIKVIDDQHKQLVAMLEDVKKWIALGQDFSALMTFVTRLADYAIKHFADEEAIMLRHNYFDFEQHKKIHADFTEKVQEELLNVIQKETVSTDLIEFIEHWLVEHIDAEAELFREHIHGEQ